MTTDNKVKETIGRAQVGNDAMTSDQPRQTIKKIWGEDGRDEEKEDEGAGRNKCRAQGEEHKDTINPRDDVYKGDRNKRSERNKNGDRNMDGGSKANGKIKEIWGEDRRDKKEDE